MIIFTILPFLNVQSAQNKGFQKGQNNALVYSESLIASDFWQEKKFTNGGGTS
jgi:hypothetical protein